MKSKMEKEFVPYQEALELKELGFDEPCFGAYGAWGFMSSNDVNSLSDDIIQEDLDNQGYSEEDGVCLAPTFSQAFRWFRENCNLIFQINYLFNGNYQVVIHKNTHEYMELIQGLEHACVDEIPDNYTYEEAELACLRKLIEIVKESKSWDG